MSLAADILKRAEEIANPPPKPRRGQRPSEPRDTDETKPPSARTFARTKPPVRARRVRHGDHVPGVSFDGRSGGWAAYFYDGTKKILIGLFSSKSRAVVARRIYMLWRKRGYYDIPNKPARRLYTNW